MRHSEKTESGYQLVEAYFPNVPKLELFARKRRAGWDSWGNEIGAAS
jgi:N6-adenosine-specific RNA methylase IME4